MRNRKAYQQIRTGDVYLSQRMEELLLKIYFEKPCENYSWFVVTINALMSRKLVQHSLKRYKMSSFQPFEVTKRGKTVAELLLEKEPK